MMSTRSQLRFVQRVEQTSEIADSADRVAQVYRHSDGYPGSVLRDLTQLKALIDATRAESGPGYAAATFVFLDKLSTVDLYLDGDPERTIDAAQPADLPEPTEWTVKVTSHSAFLRWDGPTDEAFERSDWQFHGQMEHALEELVAEPPRVPQSPRGDRR
jgi:hypothetical protein